MRAVVQRVSRASIRIDNIDSGKITKGLVILLGVEQGDLPGDAAWVASKCLGLRIFEDHDHRMNRSLADISGDALIVSQFTLFGNVRKGSRPSFNRSAPPEEAVPLYELFLSLFREQAPGTVVSGKFASYMEIDLLNEGPVTIILDSRNKDY